VLRRDPERACIEHQVSVGLDIDDQALRLAVREPDADLRRGAERFCPRADTACRNPTARVSSRPAYLR
jgi:hypothetical protein